MKKIAITMGDPGGVGPEIIAKAICCAEIRESCSPIVIGDSTVIAEAISLLKLPAKMRIIKSPEECGSTGMIALIETGEIKNFEKAKPTAENGNTCVSYIKKAIELVLEKKVDAVVTAPISKEALTMAGAKWHGHTEMLAELTGSKNYAMMFIGGPLKIILATIHTSLKNVPAMITKDRILKTIHLAKKGCDMLGINNPRIAVAGLNPHAAEGGIFGNEELREILPAIRVAINEGISASGPYPPDIIFNKAFKGEFDIVVCMYHDQGLIPLKMIAFDTGVNITVGLPIIRTSPAHGTAYDIAWKGIATPSSMIEAIKTATRLKL